MGLGKSSGPIAEMAAATKTYDFTDEQKEKLLKQVWMVCYS